MRSVIVLMILAVIALVTAADEIEPEDLGVMTPHRGIILERGSTRADWSHFLIDLVSLTPSNHVSITLTNELLTLTNLVRLPSGKITMGVTSFYKDGSHGEISLYTFDLRRGRPPKANARMINLLGGPVEVPGMTNIQQVIDHRRRVRLLNASPPLPFQSTNAFDGARAEKRPPSLSFNGPLPNGKPTSYADQLDSEAEKAMKQFYSRTGRRNQ